MYTDWRDTVVYNYRGSAIMKNCRAINPRTKLARVVRYLKATERASVAMQALHYGRLTNLVYAFKAVRDLK